MEIRLGLVIFPPGVSVSESIQFFETLKSTLDERLGVEVDRIIRTDIAIGDRDQQWDDGIVGEEQMDAPAAIGVSFHVIEKLVMTGLSQALAEIEAMTPDEQFLAPEGVAEATVLGNWWQVLIIEHVPHRLVLWKSNGDEVG
jgi:hypothetical protein